jgi:UPF0716 protein FxsA
MGGWIGLGGVLALVLGTGVLGIFLLRRMSGAVAGLRGGGIASAGQAGLLALAGLLLILPGILTDVVGAILLVPQVRAMVLRRLGARVVMHRADAGGEVIEAVAVDLGGAANETREPSGWTRG